MNTYERFDAVLNHRKPDKMPFFFPTIACSVASAILGRPVNSGADSLHFKEERSWLDGESAHEEFVCRYREDAIELNRKLHADVVRETWRMSGRPSKALDDNTLLFGSEDGPHVVKRFFPDEQSYGVVEDTMSPRDAAELVASLKKDMQRGAAVTEEQLATQFQTQLAFKKLAAPYFPTIFGAGGIGIPMTSAAWLEAAALEPEFLAEFFLFRAEVSLRVVPWLAKLGVRFINGGADLASNTGPVYSPATFRRILVRPLKMVAEECRKLGVTYCFNTDGNIWPMMEPMFAETGVQAYGEVDRAAGMPVGKIRARYPQLVIRGNVSSATLCNGSAADVRQETRASLEESGGLNYIAGPSNAVVHGTPADNVWAMVEEIEGYRP